MKYRRTRQATTMHRTIDQAGALLVEAVRMLRDCDHNPSGSAKWLTISDHEAILRVAEFATGARRGAGQP